MAQSIKVAVRARPLNQREKDMDCKIVVAMQDKTTTLTLNKDNPKHFTYDFAYSSIYPDHPGCANQQDVYKELGSTILSNAIDGFNGTLFAYGQTGSGKSHSMMGPEDEPGIIPLMIKDLFAQKENLETANKELQIWVSYLEIYKERITDLFGIEKQQEVKIMEHPKLGVYTKGVEEIPCATEKDVMTNLELGLQKRSIGATNMNQTSSRSHAVFVIKTTTLEGAGSGATQDERKALSAKINLIDLAGSERASKTGAEGERLKEGSTINQSLSALGLVIKNLTEKKESKVPFRSSKLTFLLKDSLAGNSRTFMLAAISPADDNGDETLSTLRFASSVKSIQTVPVQNKDKKDQLIDDLRDEINFYKTQLAAGVNSEEAMEQLKERERLVQREMHKDFQEELKAAEELQKARKQALKEHGLSQHHITKAFGISSGTPYLVNMAVDPQLAGCLIYLLKESEPTKIGRHKDNTIVLDCVNMPDFLCRIDHKPGSGVMIQRLCGSGRGRVGVNGKLLKENQQIQLRNGDQLYLGRSTALKLVCPEEDGGMPTLNKNDLLLQGDIELAMLEQSPSWASLEMFVKPVLRQMTSDAASTFIDNLKRACQLSDEANELTPEYRSDLSYQFEVDLTSSMPPCVVIRVLSCPEGRDCTDEEKWQTDYIWTLSQLEERVERMKDYCGLKKHNPDTEVDRLEDPWMEAEYVEIVRRLRDLQQAATEAGEAMQQQLQLAMSGGGRMTGIVFWYWKSLVSAEKKKRNPLQAIQGRPALVRSGTFQNKMRMTIVPNRPTEKKGRRAVVKVPDEPSNEPAPASRRRMTIKASSPEGRVTIKASSPEPSANVAAEAADSSALVQATVPSVDEAPEATPEVTTTAVDESCRSANQDVCYAHSQELIEAEWRTRALKQENEVLKKQLSEKQLESDGFQRKTEELRARLRESEELTKQLSDIQMENDDLRKQLEVAWQLSSLLRDQLLSVKPQAEEALLPLPEEPQPPDVLATADALAATARSVSAAAQAVHDIKAALITQAPRSAPGTPGPVQSPLHLPERSRRAMLAPWLGLLPSAIDGATRSASPSQPRSARSTSPLATRGGLCSPYVRCASLAWPAYFHASPPSVGQASPASWPSSYVATSTGSATMPAKRVCRVMPPSHPGPLHSPPQVARAYVPTVSASPSRPRSAGSRPRTPLRTPPAPVLAAPAPAPCPLKASRSLSPEVVRTPSRPAPQTATTPGARHARWDVAAPHASARGPTMRWEAEPPSPACPVTPPRLGPNLAVPALRSGLALRTESMPGRPLEGPQDWLLAGLPGV